MEEQTRDPLTTEKGVETRSNFVPSLRIGVLIGVIALLVAACLLFLQYFNERNYREYQAMVGLQKLDKAEKALERHLMTYPEDHRASYELIKLLYERGMGKRADGIASILMEQELELQLQYDLPNDVWVQSEQKVISVHEKIKRLAFHDNLEFDSLLKQLNEIQKKIDLLARAGDLLSNYWDEFDLDSDRTREAIRHASGHEAIKLFIEWRGERLDFERTHYLNCAATLGSPFGGSTDLNLISLMRGYADQNSEERKYVTASRSHALTSNLIKKSFVCFDGYDGEDIDADKYDYQMLARESLFLHAWSEFSAERYEIALPVFRQLKEDGYEQEKVSNLIEESVMRSALQHLNSLQEKAKKAVEVRDWQAAIAVYKEMQSYARQQSDDAFENEEARALYNMALSYGNASDQLTKRRLLRDLQRHFPEWEPELVSARLLQ